MIHVDDVARRDREIFRSALLSPSRLLTYGALALLALFPLVQFNLTNFPFNIFLAGWAGAMVAAYLVDAKKEMIAKRFAHRRYAMLWETAEDRMRRLGDALKAMKRDNVADMKVLPETVKSVSDSLYVALRRADLIQAEVERSEGFLTRTGHQTLNSSVRHQDSHVQDLYQMADRNIAEYQRRFDHLMSGMQRTEAQATVFITTLDSLRMRILGYRLMGRNPEIELQDFLFAIQEAKGQLEAVDTALAELDYTQLAQSPSMPPPLPEDVNIHPHS